VSAVDLARGLLDSIAEFGGHAAGDDVAHLEVHGNEVVGAHLVPGLDVETTEIEDGIEANIIVEPGARLAKPVHMCFGLLPSTGLQRIVMNVEVGESASASILAHCTFPNAVDVTHAMDAQITIAPGAEYRYFERHVHGPQGGVVVVPKAKVQLGEGARFSTEFELLKGRVGRMDIDYDVTCEAHAVLEMVARLIGRGDDRVVIRETGRLVGEYARAALQSHMALRDSAQAEVYNTISATAPYARGHVDCKEIVQDEAVAKAVPIVEVSDPKAHVTHEAAIGSVDSKQLQTIMSRGLDEDAAVELIIEGLLS